MKIRSANVEVTTICNGKCSLCARSTIENANYKIPVKHLDLKAFVELDWYNVPDFEFFVLCGSFGDPVLHPQFKALVKIIKSLNKRMIIHTNGAMFTEDWWADLAILLNDHDRVSFGLDGLTKETHEKYRGTNFERLLRNIRAFSAAGGHAGMNYIVFRHNEHEIPDIKNFSDRLGLEYIKLRRSRRYTEEFQAPVRRPKADWLPIIKAKRCFPEMGEVSIDSDAMIHLCCQTYVRHFIKKIIGDKTPDWVKPLKRYKTFEGIRNSVYIDYIKEMALCRPCGQLGCLELKTIGTDYET